MVRRIELIDKFGPEIEFDLLGLHLEIHDYLNGRRPWAQLDRVIARLPRHSHYKAALEDDDEIAEVALAIQLPENRARVPLVGYDETVVRLDNLFDAINAVNETLITVYSKRGIAARRSIRAERPETAHQRVKRSRSKQKLQSIEESMTGGR